MPDRAPLTVEFYDIPAGQEGAALEVLKSFDLTCDWEPVGDRVDVGTRYITDSAPLGSATSLAIELAEQAPGAVFQAHEDPVYEYLGTVVKVIPGMDRFTGECDATGAVRPHAADVRTWIREGRSTTEVDLILGHTHDEELAAAYTARTEREAATNT